MRVRKHLKVNFHILNSGTSRCLVFFQLCFPPLPSSFLITHHHPSSVSPPDPASLVPILSPHLVPSTWPALSFGLFVQPLGAE